MNIAFFKIVTAMMAPFRNAKLHDYVASVHLNGEFDINCDDVPEKVALKFMEAEESELRYEGEKFYGIFISAPDNFARTDGISVVMGFHSPRLVNVHLPIHGIYKDGNILVTAARGMWWRESGEVPARQNGRWIVSGTIYRTERNIQLMLQNGSVWRLHWARLRVQHHTLRRTFRFL